MGRNDISPRYSSYLFAFLLPPTSSDSREPSAGQMMSFIDKLTACPPTDAPCHRPFTVTAGGLIKAVEMFKKKKSDCLRSGTESSASFKEGKHKPDDADYISAP